MISNKQINKIAQLITEDPNLINETETRPTTPPPNQQPNKPKENQPPPTEKPNPTNKSNIADPQFITNLWPGELQQYLPTNAIKLINTKTNEEEINRTIINLKNDLKLKWPPKYNPQNTRKADAIQTAIIELLYANLTKHNQHIQEIDPKYELPYVKIQYDYYYDQNRLKENQYKELTKLEKENNPKNNEYLEQYRTYNKYKFKITPEHQNTTEQAYYEGAEAALEQALDGPAKQWIDSNERTYHYAHQARVQYLAKNLKPNK